MSAPSSRRLNNDDKLWLWYSQAHGAGADMSWFGDWYALDSTGRYGKDSIVTGDISTAVREISSTIPEGYSISNPFPAPFNPEANIEFTIPRQSHVNLKVYNVLGQLVETLVNQEFAAGKYAANFYGQDKASGIYFFKIDAIDDKNNLFTDVKKAHLVK